MTQPFSMTVSHVGPNTCELTQRKAACVRIDFHGPCKIPSKIIDRRRITDLFVMGLGAAELFSNESPGLLASEANSTMRSESKSDALGATVSDGDAPHVPKQRSKPEVRSSST